MTDADTIRCETCGRPRATDDEWVIGALSCRCLPATGGRSVTMRATRDALRVAENALQQAEVLLGRRGVRDAEPQAKVLLPVVQIALLKVGAALTASARLDALTDGQTAAPGSDSDPDHPSGASPEGNDGVPGAAACPCEARVKELTEALREIDGLFASIRDDWTDPRGRLVGRWKHTAPNTTAWHGRYQFGRVTVAWHIYKHHGALPDRWVFQPHLIVDRKRPS